MQTSANPHPTQVSFSKILTVAALLAITTLVLNNLYAYLYSSATGVSLPEVINFTSISAASVLPVFAAAVFYYLLSLYNPLRADVIYWVTVVVLALISLAGPLSGTLPDGSPRPEGFTLLTLPMHVITGVFIFLLPKIARAF
jgi:hypothetical protein